MPTDPERRSRLLSLKLRALVRDHLGLAAEPEGRPLPYGNGAAFVGDDAVWLLDDGDGSRAVGPAVAWTIANAPRRPLHIIAGSGAGTAARRAALLDFDISVWTSDERSLVPVTASPHLPVVAVDTRHVSFAALIESAGAEVTVEHGVVAGEVRGLEMCRVVDDRTTGEPRLEVGMGAHDREAFAMVHGHLPTTDALRQVIDAVLPHREDGAVPHPLNRFATERLLRWHAVQDPRSVGCSSLSNAEPPVPRTNLKDTVPCVAGGVLPDGETVAVTFASGVDLDAVPFALDAADRMHAHRAVLALRDRDIVPSLRSLAALARDGLDVVDVRWPLA